MGIDLHIYDAQGHHYGFTNPDRGIEHGIPDSFYSPDSGNLPETETFTDNAFYASAPALNRAFGYMVCFYGPYFGNVDVGLTVVDRDGTPHAMTITSDAGTQRWFSDEGVPFPAKTPC